MSTLKRKAEALTASAEDLKKPKKDSTLTSFFGVPKTTSSSPAASKSSSTPVDAPPEPAPTKFEKEKWVSSLKPEQKELLKLEIDTLDPSWLAHLKEELVTPDFLNLKRFLKKEIDARKKIFPPLEEVYSWSRHTPLNTVKVVILGQDPYHNHNQAHGLCFSVRPPTPAPPSLKNIFSSLKRDYPSFIPPPKNGGLLTPWAEQGVLMLNTCLTVEAHQPASHQNKGWEKFTQKVIDTVVKVRTRGVVFLAWGLPAQKRCASVKSARHVVMKSMHPSPMAASRGGVFDGNFKAANQWLVERYGEEGAINWDLNKPKPIAAPKLEEPVKVTDTQERVDEAGPVTELPEKKGGEKVVQKEEFEGEDDEDAIEALEELARSSMDGDLDGGLEIAKKQNELVDDDDDAPASKASS